MLNSPAESDGAPTHHFMVAYFHSNGRGRSFVSTMGPVDTPEAVIALEALVQQNNPTLSGIGITNFQPLQSAFVGSAPVATDSSAS